jgi:glycosyltransferase involved in cell wall biosynthesis
VAVPTWLRWNDLRQRPHELLGALARSGHPVFFVDPTRRTPIDDAGVTIVPTIRDLPASGVVLYTHFAPARTLFDRFDGAAVVYDVLDDLSMYASGERGLPPGRRVEDHHGRLMADSDLVIASSQTLVERHRAERADLLLVENGVDIARFGVPRPRPDDMPAGAPVVGYHGAIAPWVDFELLTASALMRPHWSFVLVGPVLPEAVPMARALERLGNVHLLGERAAADIAAYVGSFDVGTVPFRIDRMTEAVSPLKMFEYLAAGVPVVATPLPACAAVPVVRIAAGVDDFVTQLEAALADGAEAGYAGEARRLAEAASWDRRIEPLLERLDALGARRVPS